MRHDPRRLEPAAYAWSVELGTRFGDMDVNRHLNNVAVAGLYEEARVRFHAELRACRAIGNPRFLVAHCAIDYLGEGDYPEPVTVMLAVLALGTSSYRMGAALLQRERCIGLCDTVLVHRGESGPAPLPDALRTVLGEFAIVP